MTSPTDPIYSTPHRYVPSGVPQWRTCKLCGAGANAVIHKQQAHECDNPIHCSTCLAEASAKATSRRTAARKAAATREAIRHNRQQEADRG